MLLIKQNNALIKVNVILDECLAFNRGDIIAAFQLLSVSSNKCLNPAEMFFFYDL